MTSLTPVRDSRHTPLSSVKAASMSRGRQAPGIHLHGQLLEHLRIALEQLEQLRAERLRGVSDLGQFHLEAPLGGVHMPRFIPAAVAVARTALVVRTADEIRLLGLQAFLHHQGGGQTHQLAEGLRSVVRRSHVLKKA